MDNRIAAMDNQTLDLEGDTQTPASSAASDNQIPGIAAEWKVLRLVDSEIYYDFEPFSKIAVTIDIVYLLGFNLLIIDKC